MKRFPVRCVEFRMRFVCAAALALLAVAPLAQAQYQPRRGGPGTGNPDEHRVPWRFVQGDSLASDRPITLIWIPATLEQVDTSRLTTSNALRVASTRCVDMEIAMPDRAAIMKKLGVDGRAPAAVLVDRKGDVIRRAESAHGVLAVEEVERMVNGELAARDEAMYRDLTAASRQERAGNNAAAIELYKKIWDDRCLFPLAGSEAQRALARLGVVVKEPPPTSPVDPNLKPPAKKPGATG